MVEARDLPDKWVFIRGVLLFICGMAGIAHQTLVADLEKPQLLLLFGGMIGLPVVLNREPKPKPEDAPPPPAPQTAPAQPPPGASP